MVDATTLEIMADFPCQNELSPMLPGRNIRFQINPIWKRDDNSGVISVAVQIDAGSCQLAPKKDSDLPP